ncbi:MAG TPA: hypothetical protein DCS13_03430 [Candidatus Margulisbacteria bacterium]|nr:MAG: hypothetical protein A2X43_03525 [Candidatus Margulisbacteria bacterium GWD2_39_127]HAR62493.1 hypothetical protein [Candidatus Margulisiibacteriota bacterium]
MNNKLIAINIKINNTKDSLPAAFEKFVRQKCGAGSLREAFLTTGIAPEELLHIYAKNKDEQTCQAIEQYFYHTRLKILTEASLDDFMDLPADMKIEYLLTTRSRKKVANTTNPWFKQLSGQAAPDSHYFINSICINNMDLPDHDKEWVVENWKEIENRIEEQKRELLNNKDLDLTEEQINKAISAGIINKYITTYKLSKSNIDRAARNNSKIRLKTIYEIKQENTDLSDYDCKQLAIIFPDKWKEILYTTVAEIKAENPTISNTDSKQLAITYPNTWRKILNETITEIKAHFPDLSNYEAKLLAIKHPKNWKNILNLVTEIKEKNPGLSDYDCKVLAIKNPNTWKIVLSRIQEIKEENPELSDYYCTQLALNYPGTWRDILHKTTQEIKRDNPELSDSYCIQLAMSYPNKWEQILSETMNEIKKQAPSISDADTKKLAISYPNTWEKILHETTQEIRTANPGLADYAVINLAIHYPNTWKKILHETTQEIKTANLGLTDYAVINFAIHYPNNWRKILFETYPEIRRQNPGLSDSQAKTLAMGYPNAWSDIVSQVNEWQQNNYIKRHIPKHALFSLAQSDSQLKDNFKEIIDQMLLNNNNDYLLVTHEKSWGEKEKARAKLAITLLSLLFTQEEIEQVFEGFYNSPREKFTALMELVAISYGWLGILLIKSLKEKEPENTMGMGFYSGNLAAVDDFTAEDMIIEEEHSAAWQSKLQEILTEEEYTHIINWAYKNNNDINIVKTAIKKIYHSGIANVIRDALNGDY